MKRSIAAWFIYFINPKPGFSDIRFKVSKKGDILPNPYKPNIFYNYYLSLLSNLSPCSSSSMVGILAFRFSGNISVS